MLLREPRYTLFPYTTLFRSEEEDLWVGPHIGAIVGHKNRDIANDLHSTPVGIALQPAPLIVEQELQIGVELKLIIELRSEEHTSELQSLRHLVCRLLLEKKK